jgi:hypothetical protein
MKQSSGERARLVRNNGSAVAWYSLVFFCAMASFFIFPFVSFVVKVPFAPLH